MDAASSDRLRSHGFAAIPGALMPDEVARVAAGLDRVYEEEVAGGRTPAGEPMHLLGEIGRDDAFLDLLDHPAVFPLICAELGWNIHLYHCHLDVTPPRAAPPRPSAWGWHQDGGRQNLDLESDPRPRMSLKVAFWLSDVSGPGRGNILVVPGSHERNTLARPDDPEPGFDPPAGAEPVLASPGDALVFDRRLWHSRSDNLSDHTRRVVFLAYSFRWVRPRDELGMDPSSERFRALSPVRRQLLGEPADRRHQWGLRPEAVPLKAELSR
jgi:ectoine hydroxylase